jgi:MEMO1 family protein
MSGIFPKFSLFQVILAIFLAAFLPCPAVSATVEPPAGRIHEPILAGTWYPGNSEELRAQVANYLDRVPARDSNGRIVALISPHAGYIYSGQVAAHSYKLLIGQKFDTVIVIGPSHQVAFSGVATYDCEGFRTPLGVIPIDTQLIKTLTKSDSRIKDLPEVFKKEHSIEIQLPFLQATLPSFKLVPLVMGDYDLTSCRKLSETISESIKGKSVLIVASSDLSHYHSYETAREMDLRLLEKVRTTDVEGLNECLESGKCEACGRAPITAATLAAKKLGADRCDILQYANSGDVTGEKNSSRGVVGYAAAVIWKTPSDKDSSDTHGTKPGIDLGLSADERAQLHSIARQVIDARCGGKNMPKISTASSKLKEPSGAFVTLYKNGELRGCIGQVIARKPLIEAVAEMAEAAAFQDPRFSPLRSDELKDVKIEISVLTPFKKIDSPEQIEVGKHGIIIKRGNSMGLLLPQVATEYGWDRTAFLENTCRKAGLPKDAWKDKETEILIFSADVF